MEKTAKQIIEERIATEETEQTIFSPEERQLLTDFAYQTNDTAAAQKLFTEISTAGYGAAYGGFDPQLEERLCNEHPLYDGTTVPTKHSTEAVLPVLASIARRQEEKIEALQDKIANLERKIDRNENKIQRLQSKVATLEKDTALLQGIAKRVPALANALNVLITRNEKRISEIKTVKIPRRQEKIQSHKQKIAKHEVKLSKAEKKLSRTMHLSSFLKNFTKLDKAERREGYIAGLTALTNDMQERNERKQMKLQDRLESVENRLQQTQGQDSELAEKRASLRDKLDVLRDKIEKLERKSEQYDDMQKLLHGVDEAVPNEQSQLVEALDKTIERSTDVVPEMPSIRVSDMVDTIVMQNKATLTDELHSMPSIEVAEKTQATLQTQPHPEQAEAHPQKAFSTSDFCGINRIDFFAFETQNLHGVLGGFSPLTSSRFFSKIVVCPTNRNACYS